MKNLQKLFLVFVLLLLAIRVIVAQSSPSAAVTVTFQVDMAVQILEKKFSPGIDQLSVRGSFNDFAEGVNLLTDADGDSIYTAAVNLPDALAGSTISFEYFYLHGARGVGESIVDRQFAVPVTGGIVPLSFFDVDSVVTAGPLLIANSPGNKTPGAQFVVQISLGDSAMPVANLFGVSFELNFTNTAFVDVVAGSVIPGPFLGNDLLFFPYIDETAGKVSAGISRKFGQGGVSGHGVVMEARFTSLPSIPNGARVDFFITSIVANDADGNAISLNPGAMTVTIGACPSVSSINPAAGEVGSTVTINGANFGGISAVKFANNIAADFTLASATQILATVPNGAVTGPITLSKTGCPDVQTSTFTVRACPSVSSISPVSAGVGEEITINGNNFSGVTAVLFTNNVPATITNVTATQIRVTVPSGAVSGPLTIRKPSCDDVQTPGFTLLCPAVTAISPTSGISGTNVIISGSNLSGVTSVVFSENVAAAFTIDNANQITATVPAAAVTGPITLGQTGCTEILTPEFTLLSARKARLVSRSVSGNSLRLAVELSSHGNENALSFSLSFDPAILSNPRATQGVDAGTAQLNVNTSQAAAGRLGLLLALPSGQSFTVGDRELLLVDFDVMPSVEATTIDFSDQPIPREILDTSTNSLAATWTPATINLPVGYEADVAPRPFGSRDGTVDLDDWIQSGRFIAVLDTPQTASNEFQRLDCSPRACGDGRLSLADWVQAGRYAAGFDTVTAACGPNNAIAGLSAYTTQNSTSARMISAQNDTFISGQNGSLIINLAADGSENAFGFSLNYDANLLTFLNVSLGANATDATLHINDRHKANGRIGIIMALPAGQIFSINDRQLLSVNFAAKPNTNIVTTVTFDDAVIMREAVDVEANTLQTSWSSATITIQTPPTTVEETEHEIPASFELGQNYPNPFNPSTSISFATPHASRVTIKVFNLLGKEVATLVDQTFAAGRFQTTWDAVDMESGVYFYRMQAEGFVKIRKLLLVQ